MGDDGLYSKERVDEILGIPQELLPGEQIAWIRDNIPEWNRPLCWSIQQIAFSYVGTEKDKSLQGKERE